MAKFCGTGTCFQYITEFCKDLDFLRNLFPYRVECLHPTRNTESAMHFQYSPTQLGQTWIPRNHVFLEHTLFSLYNSSKVLLKIHLGFMSNIFKDLNTDSSNCLPLFTNKTQSLPLPEIKQILRI